MLNWRQFNLGVALNAFVERAPKAPEAAAALRYMENPRRARENYAPEFALTTHDEQRLTLEDLKGKVVLLDFLGDVVRSLRQGNAGTQGAAQQI